MIFVLYVSGKPKPRCVTLPVFDPNRFSGYICFIVLLWFTSSGYKVFTQVVWLDSLKCLTCMCTDFTSLSQLNKVGNILAYLSLWPKLSLSEITVSMLVCYLFTLFFFFLLSRLCSWGADTIILINFINLVPNRAGHV